MKRFTFFASLMAASLMCVSAAEAAVPDGQAALLSKLKKQDNKPYASYSVTRAYRLDSIRSRMAAEAKAPAAHSFDIADPATLHKVAAQEKTERLDSIVCKTMSTGEPYSLQTFEYDEKNQPVSRVNYLPDGYGGWMPVEYYGYTWDDEGYCLSQWAYSDYYNSGQRYDYTYNDRNLGDTQVIYNYVDGEWVPVAKGEYWYDEAGNLDEEKTYNYVDGQWVPYAWTTVSFDAAGNQLSYESLSWNGSAWVHLEDRMEYAYDEDGHQLLWSFNRWQEDTQSWLNYYRIEQDFNDDGVITRQENKYWNVDLQSWDGAYDWGYGLCYNTKTLFEYDEQVRKTAEKSYTAYTAGNYVFAGTNEITYTPLDNGVTESYQVTKLYDYNGENPYEEGHLKKRYDAAGHVIYAYEEKYEGSQWVSKYEEEHFYDEAGNELTSFHYMFDDNVRRNDIRLENLYDENNNIIDNYNYNGTGSGEDDWEPYTRFTYAYEQDTVRVEKLAYFWDGAAFKPSWGDGVVYDYDVPVENLVMWIGTNTYHKILENRTYTGLGDDWDYQSFKYYYTELVPTGIGRAAAAADGKVLKTAVVSDRLETASDAAVDIAVYNMQGACLLKTHGTSADVSSLPSGLYVARLGSASAKFIKR